MATIRLPPDFKEFLRLLKEHKVRYLLIGGYAVNYYGYIRTTGDMDIWIARDADNVGKIVAVLKALALGISLKSHLNYLCKRIRLSVWACLKLSASPVRTDWSLSLKSNTPYLFKVGPETQTCTALTKTPILTIP